MDTRRIFFFHNPKSGGTSVQLALQNLFPAESRCPLIENSQRDHEARAGDYREFAGYDFYAGHYGADIYRAIAPDHLPITCFREPLARLISLYTYFAHRVPVPDDSAARDNLYPVIAAQNLSFEDFVLSRDPRIEIHTRNHHARQLSASGWDPSCAGDLHQAASLVARMKWFFVAEHGEFCAGWAGRVFGLPAAAFPRANITGHGPIDPATLSLGTRRGVRERNELDFALHEIAVRHLARL